VQGGEAAGSYVLTEASHHAIQQPGYQNREDIETPYENSFRCIKSTVPYVPLPLNPKPVAYGLDTAFVIDETASGNTEEIWPDKYGRVRVRFHWDRESKYACWVRVVQSWAGRAWGHQWIPRVGDEVVVSFLHGDPDCPVVTGSVYNKDNMPVFTLPDNKTQSGLVTRSSMKGGAANYNMLRFEDKKGSEEIFLQAEKDMNSVIEHDETRKVGNDRTTTIHVNDAETVETGDHTLTVQQGNRIATIHQNETVTVQSGDRSVTISQGSDSLTISMGDRATTVSMGGVTTKSPMGTNETDAMQVNINGTMSVKLTCGASSIEMSPATIKITAPMVLINS
jgi:type VI secretion system secreted protein VgrG